MPNIRSPQALDYGLNRRRMRQRSATDYSQYYQQPQQQQGDPLGGIAQNIAMNKLAGLGGSQAAGAGSQTLGTAGVTGSGAGSGLTAGSSAGSAASSGLGGFGVAAPIIGAALVARNQIEKSKYFKGRGPLGKLGEASRIADPFHGYNITQIPKEALRRPAHYLNASLNPLQQTKINFKALKSLFG